MVNRAVNPNNTLPVLNNILIKAEGRQVLLSATNLEIAISAAFPAAVENEGALTVPAKAITSYVSLLSNERIELQVLNGNALEIKSTGSKTDMKGLPSEEFPLLPKLDKPSVFKLPVKNLSKALEQVVFAASTNLSRPILTGIFWQLSGKTLKLAATDSYRLAEKTLELEKNPEMDLNFLLPSRTAQELAKILGSSQSDELEIAVSKGQILFKVDGVELFSRLIEGNFPEYEKILPSESKSHATLSTEEFILALKKISVIVRDSNNNIRVRLEPNKLLVFSEETQLGKGHIEIPVQSHGETMEAALNVQYLLDVLGHLEDDQVYFGLNDSLSPVRVVPARPSGYLHIIMPLKV